MGGKEHYSKIDCAEFLKDQNTKLRADAERIKKDALYHSEAGIEAELEKKAALQQNREKDGTIRKLFEALIVRRAMEPKHSDMEHECPECDLVAEIIRLKQTERRLCIKCGQPVQNTAHVYACQGKPGSEPATPYRESDENAR